MTEKAYLFAGGCARSGTTALAKVLNCHDKVRIGIERFNLQWMHETLSPAVFETDRFFDVRAEDHRRWENVGKQLPALREGYEDAAFVGDKYPSVYKHYEMLAERFAPLRIVYIVRNPVSVALSFQRRFENPHDSFPHDGKRALNIWHGSIRTTVGALERGLPITVVSYERLFKSSDAVGTLFEALGLDPGDVDRKRLDRVLARFAQSSAAPRPVPEDLARHIFAFGKTRAYRKLIETHCLFRDTGTANATTDEAVFA